MNPEIVTSMNRHRTVGASDGDSTRRRHDFWRNVIGPRLDVDRSSNRPGRCLEPAAA